MQFKPKDYNPEQHDRFKALTVHQPYADFIGDDKKHFELRNQNTKFRGRLLICSSAKEVDGHQSGCTIAFVDVVDTKRVKDLTPEELKQTMADDKTIAQYKNSYAWVLTNARRTIEFPVKGQQGIFNLIYTKDCIMQYPKYAEVEQKQNKKARREIFNFIFWLLMFWGIVVFLIWAAVHD